MDDPQRGPTMSRDIAIAFIAIALAVFIALTTPEGLLRLICAFALGYLLTGLAHHVMKEVTDGYTR